MSVVGRYPEGRKPVLIIGTIDAEGRFKPVDDWAALLRAIRDGLPSGVTTLAGSASVSATSFGTVVSFTLAAGATAIIFGWGVSHDVANSFKIAGRLYDETAAALIGPYKTAPPDHAVESNTPIVVVNTDTVDHTIAVQAYNAHTAALDLYAWCVYKILS